jgi:hypothetical protein
MNYMERRAELCAVAPQRVAGGLDASNRDTAKPWRSRPRHAHSRRATGWHAAGERRDCKQRSGDACVTGRMGRRDFVEQGLCVAGQRKAPASPMTTATIASFMPPPSTMRTIAPGLRSHRHTQPDFSRVPARAPAALAPETRATTSRAKRKIPGPRSGGLHRVGADAVVGRRRAGDLLGRG